MGPIGVFDSGYGGLTVLKEIVKKLPQYDYIYFGDNARAPYGTRSYETVYQYTLQAVKWFFKQGCPLVILACNTASAKALRTIQKNDLQPDFSGRRVLGVIRPTTEKVGSITLTGKVGVLGTNGTVSSLSYPIEIKKFFPDLHVFQEACPMWVPLIENMEYESPGADFFIKKSLQNLLSQDPEIDTILLACTHYPLIRHKIESFVAQNIQVIEQGHIVAASLQHYLTRHNALEQECTKRGSLRFYTTDAPDDFDKKGSGFFGAQVHSTQIDLEDVVFYT